MSTRRTAIVAFVVAGVAVVAASAAFISARNAGPEAATDSRERVRPVSAAVTADALLRRARTESDASHAIEAERILRDALDENPADYDATRMLATVLLTQHRFHDALPVAERARAMRPSDEWNDGTSGDAWLEIGDYDKAFEAYDRMVTRRPNAASYARVSYARELQGDLDSAVDMMRMAAQATPASDSESLAWHAAQLGNLLLRQGKLEDAEREFKRAEFSYPGHPYAQSGFIRLEAARGDYRAALDRTRAEMQKAETPELAAWAGDLSAKLGDAAGASSYYAQMEALEREGWESEEPQPGALGRMLAERSLKPEEALALAERAARTRNDIHTMDAVAWAAYRAGNLKRAAEAAAQAISTGTREQRILAHAAAIALAAGDPGAARDLAQKAVAGGPYDLLAYDEAQRVLAVRP